MQENMHTSLNPAFTRIMAGPNPYPNPYPWHSRRSAPLQPPHYPEPTLYSLKLFSTLYASVSASLRASIISLRSLKYTGGVEGWKVCWNDDNGVCGINTSTSRLVAYG